MRSDPPWWLVGLLVGGVTILGLLVAALIYRILSILIGEQLTQLVLGLGVVIGLAAALFDWATGRGKPGPA